MHTNHPTGAETPGPSSRFSQTRVERAITSDTTWDGLIQQVEIGLDRAWEQGATLIADRLVRDFAGINLRRHRLHVTQDGLMVGDSLCRDLSMRSAPVLAALHAAARRIDALPVDLLRHLARHPFALLLMRPEYIEPCARE